MSKITNDGLTRSGTGCFIAVLYPYGLVGVKGLMFIISTVVNSPIETPTRIVYFVCFFLCVFIDKDEGQI